MKALLRRFFGPDPAAIQNTLNLRELAHAALGAFGVSSVVGLLILLLGSISAHASQVFPSPTIAALASFVIAQSLDQLRRLDHGEPPQFAPLFDQMPTLEQFRERRPAKAQSTKPGEILASPDQLIRTQSAVPLSVEVVQVAGCPEDPGDPAVGGPGYMVGMDRGNGRYIDHFLLLRDEAVDLRDRLDAALFHVASVGVGFKPAFEKLPA